jgi:hypothetical protein
LSPLAAVARSAFKPIPTVTRDQTELDRIAAGDRDEQRREIRFELTRRCREMDSNFQFRAR